MLTRAREAPQEGLSELRMKNEELRIKNWGLRIEELSGGPPAGSVALVGFGIDSIIESSSGAVLLWRLRDGERGEERERVALRLVGWSFLLLAAYVAFDAAKSLFMREPP